MDKINPTEDLNQNEIWHSISGKKNKTMTSNQFKAWASDCSSYSQQVIQTEAGWRNGSQWMGYSEEISISRGNWNAELHAEPDYFKG